MYDFSPPSRSQINTRKSSITGGSHYFVLSRCMTEKLYVEADRRTVPPARRWFWRSSWFHHDIWSPWLAVMILLMSEDCNILSRSSLRAQLNDIPSRLERPTRPDGAKKKQTRYRHTQTRRITQTDRATEPRKIKQSLNSESNCV